MNRKKLILVLVIMIALTANIWAAGTSEAAVNADAAEENHTFEPVTVIDALGREVTIDDKVRSIAFTHYSTAEAVKILDAWDMVVALDGFTSDSLLYPDVDDLPRLTAPMDGPYTPNMEKLFELSPDLLIVEIIPMPGIEELIEKLEGIMPVIAVKTYEPDEMSLSFRNLGELTDRLERAEDFIAWSTGIRKLMLDKTGNLSESEKTRLFFKTGWGSIDDLMSFSDEMSYVPIRNRVAGCTNVAADLPSQGGWVPNIDPEWLTSIDYEILIIGDPLRDLYGTGAVDTGPLADYLNQVSWLPAFSGSSAVQDGRVYLMAEVFFGTPRHVVGFAYLAKWCHPELFADLNPKALHQEYMSRFLEVDVDLDKQGVFVYPEF